VNPATARFRQTIAHIRCANAGSGLLRPLPQVAAAGAAPDPRYPLDGEGLDLLTDRVSITERTLFWRVANRRQRTVRRGNWKYLNIGLRLIGP
jgi:hypothetical protein